MKNIKIILGLVSITALLFNCSPSENGRYNNPSSFTGTYVQEDQMGRPAVNTVFVSAGSKDMFNATIPSQQSAMFQSMFQTNLTTLSPAYANIGDQNALGLDAATFTSVLATDDLLFP